MSALSFRGLYRPPKQKRVRIIWQRKFNPYGARRDAMGARETTKL
jgi:hypothetical protein